MPYTVNQIARRLSLEYTEIDSDPVYIERIEGWINEAFTDLIVAVRWDFNIGAVEAVATVASTAEYSLSTSVSEVTAGRNTSSNLEIIYITYEELAAREADLDRTGTPKYFYLSGYTASTGVNKITLYPVPSAVYNLEFKNMKRPERLLSATTIPLPEELISPLMNRVRVELSQDDGHLEDATWRLNLFAHQLQQRKSQENTKVARYRNREIQDVGKEIIGLPQADPSKYPRQW